MLLRMWLTAVLPHASDKLVKKGNDEKASNYNLLIVNLCMKRVRIDFMSTDVALQVLMCAAASQNELLLEDCL